VPHAATYWLLLTLRDTAAKPTSAGNRQVHPLRTHLLMIAAHITETATRVRIAFATACPEAALPRISRSASRPPDRDARGAWSGLERRSTDRSASQLPARPRQPPVTNICQQNTHDLRRRRWRKADVRQ
jgi:hypothetical protein